jgi:hypothetical protein
VCNQLAFQSPADDWRADGYRWRQNGTKKLPQTSPRLSKVYFNIATPDGNSKCFQKELFHPHGHKLVVIHYLGDEGTAVDYPHGNAKSITASAHQKTAPSVLASLKQNDGTASEIYKKKVQQYCPPGHTMLLPKNMKQVYNAQYNTRQKMRLTRDALYNLHEMAYDSPSSIKRITTYPDLQVVCMDSSMATEFSRLLKTKSPSPQMMTYDATFQLGDFYMCQLFSSGTLCWRVLRSSHLDSSFMSGNLRRHMSSSFKK